MKRALLISVTIMLALSLSAAVAAAQGSPNNPKSPSGAMLGPSLAPGSPGGAPGIRVMPRSRSSDDNALSDGGQNHDKERRKERRLDAASERNRIRPQMADERIRQARREASDRADRAMDAAIIEMYLGIVSAVASSGRRSSTPPDLVNRKS